MFKSFILVCGPTKGVKLINLLHLTIFISLFVCSTDFKHALVLEPQNKAALLAEKRLKKLAG